MARAAVNAKAKAKAASQAKKGQPAAKAQPRHAHGRRRHAGGGNPNQQLFFMRLRRRAKFVYVILAVLFAVTFAFLGVGSGTNSGLDQLFNGLNIFHSSGNSVSKALDETRKHPNDPQGFRHLATAYEAKGDTANAISALRQYTTLKPKDAPAWGELANLQLTQAQTYAGQYSSAYSAQQLAAPGQAFLPTGTLGTAIGQNAIEQAAAQRSNAATTDLYQRTLLAYTDAVSSYKQLTKLQPSNADAQFQLAQAARTAGDYATAIAAYKTYAKLNPDAAPQVEQLIKQLSGATGAQKP